MDVLNIALMVLVGLVVALATVYVVSARRFRIHYAPAEVLPVRTLDGYTLFLYRHRHEDLGPARGAVLCLHGLGASHFNFDFPGTANLAGYLAKAGYDVFVASYRGDPDSVHPRGRPRRWTFDDFVNLDLPPLVEAAQEKSGQEKIHLMGHSMGGLLAYAYAAVHGQERIASIITMGAPVGFAEKTQVARELVAMEPWLRQLPSLPVRLIARALAPFIGLFHSASFMHRQFNPHNVDRASVGIGTWHALSNVSRGLLLQFADWIRHDAFRSSDGRLDYREALSELNVPLLVVAGAVDALCRPSNAMRAYDLAQSPFKRRMVLGKSNGCALDYGHIDLIFGQRAQEEVFPHLQRFLFEVESLDQVSQRPPMGEQ